MGKVTQHERALQERVFGALWGSGYLAFHPANEFVPVRRELAKATAARRRRSGVLTGVPDVIIVSPPPLFPALRGAVLELKDVGRRPTKEQRALLDSFQGYLWAADWADTWEKALSILRGWGYRIGPPVPPGIS